MACVLAQLISLVSRLLVRSERLKMHSGLVAGLIGLLRFVRTAVTPLQNGEAVPVSEWTPGLPFGMYAVPGILLIYTPRTIVTLPDRKDERSTPQVQPEDEPSGVGRSQTSISFLLSTDLNA
jgi:hypothetical protein